MSSSSPSSSSSTSPSSPSSQGITTDTVYSGLATFGRIRVIILTIVMSIVSIGMLIGGIYMTVSKKNYNQTTAVLSNVQCSPPNTQGQMTCTFTATYSVNDKTFTKNLSQQVSTALTNGSVIDIFYNTQNPSEISIGDISPSKMGWILIASAIGLGLLTALIFYLTMKYKAFAAVEGVAGIFDVVRR